MDVLGRDEELGSVCASLDRPAVGMTALVLEGEAGIGKSTLWLAGLDAARERGWRVLSSRPAEVELGVAHAGLGDLLEDALAEVLPDLAAPRRRALELALLLGGEEQKPVDFRTLAVAVRSALLLLAERDPILLAIDDVQWLDPSTSGTLAFALRRLANENIRLLLARRVGDGVAASKLELAVDPERVEHLLVGPLSPGALHGILQRRLDRAFARPTLLRLHEASGGNPFFALELARMLGSDVDPTRPLPVPETLEVAVRARLDELPQKTRETLLLVSAHARITPALLDGAALEPAFADNVVEVANGVVRFTHPLLASMLYQGASAAARRHAHAHLAETVDDPLVRARHQALAAVEPDREIAGSLERAAILARAQGAPILAAELGEHALRLTPASAPDDRHRRAVATARAHLAAGEGARPRAIALDLLATARPGPPRAEALVLLAELENLDDSMALLEDALLEAGASPPLQAEIHQRLATLGRFINGRSWAEGHARAALEIAEQLDDDALRVGAMSVLAALRFDVGDADGPRLAEEAHELAGASLDPDQLHLARWALVHVLVWSVRTERARELLEAEHRWWSDHDERRSGMALWYLALVEFRAGRWALAAEYADRAHEIGVQYNAVTPQDWFGIALVAVHRGELDRARTLAEYAQVLAEEQGALLPGLTAITGVAVLWSGDAAAAVERFAAAERTADTAGMGEPTHRWWRADFAEALLELGRVSEAAALVESWEADAARVGRDWVLAHASRCRGLIAAARGDIDDALAGLERAVLAHEVVADPFGRARALLALGVVRRRARRKRPAREALEAALTGFEDLGAAVWAERARAELGQIGGRTAIEGLTPAELRVAALVVEGRTNREVAAALFLGERTVASHLTRIYSKLDVRSRTELAGKVQTF